MKIKELFQKDIYRNIFGVISKQMTMIMFIRNLMNMVTKEMDKHFHDFFLPT